MSAHDLRAAAFDVLHGLFMAGQHLFAIFFEILRAVFAEDVG
jgi:hypothetical protein